MPKFKDLGINAIPITMRPPEMGYGGGGGQEGPTTQCQNTNTCVKDDHTTECHGNRTCIDDDNTTQCGGEGSTCKPDYETTQCGGRNRTCVEDETTECHGHATCRPDDDVSTECIAGFTCAKKDEKKASAQGFSAEDVARLRQQLDGQIDNSLEI